MSEGMYMNYNDIKSNDSKARHWVNLMAVLLIPALLVCLVILSRYRSNTDLYEIEVLEEYLNYQEIEDGSRSFQIDLTDVGFDYDLLIRTAQQEMKIFVNDEVIYECIKSEDQLLGEMPTSQWHLIQLSDELRDEVITIQIYSSYDMYAEIIPYISYGAAGDLISYVTMNTLLSCLIAWITILLGIGSIIVCIIYRHRDIYYINYLGIFLIMFGIWSWGESKTILFNYTDQFLQSQITFLMIMLIPIPIVLYFRHKTVTGLGIKVLDIYRTICMISTGIGIILALTKTVDLIEYIFVSQVLLAVGVVILVLENFLDNKGEEQNSEMSWLYQLAVLMLLVGTAWEIYNLYCGTIFYIGTYIRIGVVIFIGIIFEIEILEFRKKKERAIAAEEKMKRQLEAAKLHILNDKMSPHFICNTLVAIQELCYSDPEEAARSIGIFSKYIRINLEGIGEKRLISFKKELEYIQFYMSIQKMCFEEDVEFETDLQVIDFGVPPFSIQPIIENAVVHGIRKSLHRGTVCLRTRREKDMIVIQVEDNGIGFDSKDDGENKQTRFNSGAAVAYRIEQLLNGQIAISSRINKGTLVTIQIPASRDKELNYE